MAKQRLTEQEVAQIISEIRARLRQVVEGCETPRDGLKECFGALAEEMVALFYDGKLGK